MQKLKKILAPLLLALLSMSLTSVAYANDSGDFKTSVQSSTTTVRQISIDQLGGSIIVIRSSVENGTVENHFGILVSTIRWNGETFVPGVVIHVAFAQDTEVGDVEDESFFHMRVAYLRLIEFNDANGNGAFDTGEQILSSVNMSDLSYQSLTYSPITSDDGKQGWEIVAKSVGGLFEVDADIFPQYAVVNGTIVPPTATKITTKINGYNFTSTTSRIALQLQATSKYIIEHETPSTEERVRVRSATAEGFFSWAPTSTVDGSSADVKSSTQQVDQSHRWIISLAYKQGQSIVHDPVLGFDFGATPILTTRLLIGAAVAAIAVFGVLVYLGRRQLARVFNPKQVSPVNIPQ